MKTLTIPLVAVALSSLVFVPVASAQESSPPPVAPNERIEKLNPFTVSAIYAAVEIQFVLSGQNLFDPMADPVEAAEITAVLIRDPDDSPEVAIGDKLLRIDGVELRGLTIPQIANLLNEARSKGVPAWEISQTIGTKIIKFDGDWLTPLPGLKR
jgi:hypothetical protein